jgi:hypothetical protein
MKNRLFQRIFTTISRYFVGARPPRRRTGEFNDGYEDASRLVYEADKSGLRWCSAVALPTVFANFSASLAAFFFFLSSSSSSSSSMKSSSPRAVAVQVDPFEAANFETSFSLHRLKR